MINLTESECTSGFQARCIEETGRKGNFTVTASSFGPTTYPIEESIEMTTDMELENCVGLRQQDGEATGLTV